MSHVLHELVVEDTIGMGDICAAWLTREGYLLDLERMRVRALTWLVYRSIGYSEDIDALAWLEGRLQESADTIIKEEWGVARFGSDDGTGTFKAQKRFWFVTRALGIDEEQALKAVNEFNYLPTPHRLAFLGVVRDRRPCTEVANSLGVSKDELLQLLRDAASQLALPSHRLNGFLQELGGQPHE